MQASGHSAKAAALGQPAILDLWPTVIETGSQGSIAGLVPAWERDAVTEGHTGVRDDASCMNSKWKLAGKASRRMLRMQHLMP